MIRNLPLRNSIILIYALCFMSVPAFASEADFEKRMARGVAELDAGNSAVAQEEFRAALKEHPNDPEATLYLAIALSRAGDPSAETALKTALSMEPRNPRTNLELGAFFYNRKMYDKSGYYFENLLALKPDAEMKTAAEGFLANIHPQSGGKRWGVTLTGGMQYDSNVQLAPGGVQLPVGSNRKGDWRGVLNLGLNGVALRDSHQELTGNFSLYQTLHPHLTDFNLTQTLFDAGYKRRISRLFSVKVNGGFESILLGGNRYLNDYTITPGLLATFQEGMTTGLEYRFRDSYFKNSALFPSNRDRNGVTHSIILSHRQRISEMFNLRAEYDFERELADVKAWSSSSHRGSAGLAVKLLNTLLLDFSAEAAARKYDEILAGETQVRSDTTYSGAASVTWQAFERAGVALGYYYTHNSSNLTGYDYNRGITSIMFQGRY